MSNIDIIIRVASGAAEANIKQFGNAASTAGKKLKGFQLIVQNTRGALNSFIGNLGATAALRAFTGISNGIGNAVNNMKDFETALVGVGKTTGLAGKELDDLGNEIEILSTEIPVAATELLKLGQTAAQLGVEGTDNIIKFTDTMARLSVATDVTGEAGAIAFAKIINITGESVENIDKLGSSLVALGNKFATTESQILNVSREVAKGGGRFGLTAEQVLGLSTAMSALGTEAQVAGSTIQKVFGDVEKAIGAGPDALQKFSSVLGVTNEELTALFENEPDQFFIQFVNGLKRSQDSGKKLSVSLAELGLQDRRVTKTLGPLITNTKLFNDAMKLSAKAYQDNIALKEESAAAFDTLNSDLTILDNSWRRLTNAILKTFLPAIKATIQFMADFLTLLKDSQEFFQVAAGAAALFAAELLVIKLRAFAAAGGFQLFQIRVVSAFATAQFATKGFITSLRTMRLSAIAAWAATTLPVTLVIAAIAAVGFALVKLVGGWDKVRLNITLAARALLKFSGQSTEVIDKEIQNLEEKIRLQEKSKKGVEDETEAIKIRNAIIGGAVGSDAAKRIEDAEAVAAKEKELAQKRAAERRQELQDTLKDLENFGNLRIELAQASAEQAAAVDGKIDVQEKIRIQKFVDNLTVQKNKKEEFLRRELGEEQKANQLKLQGEADLINRKNSLRQIEAEAAEARIQKQIDDEQKKFELEQELQAQRDELELANLEKEALEDGEIDAQEEIRLQKKADDFANLIAEKEIQRQIDLGNIARANNLQIKLEADRVRQQNQINKKQAADKKKTRAEELETDRQFYAGLVTLSRFGNEGLFKIAKAAGIANATIDGIAAIQASAKIGFPQNIPGIVIETARLATTLGSLKSQSFQDGGIVPGSSFSGDNVPANVNSGEMILNRQQQAELFQQANGRSTGAGGAQGDIVVQIDGEEVFRAVSRQVADGGVLGEGGV